MNTPEWLKPGIYGAIVGAIALSVVGFSWGGWMTGGSAASMANTKAHNDVIAALVPVCLNLAKSDPNHAAQLDTIRAASTYERRDAVMSAGWATVPGAEKPNADLARACVTALKLDAS